jgi:hypothetical protein
MHGAQEEQAAKCGIDTDAVTEQRDSIGAIISVRMNMKGEQYESSKR